MLARVASALAKWVKPVSVPAPSSTNQQKSEAPDFQRQFPRDEKKKKRHLQPVPTLPQDPKEQVKPEQALVPANHDKNQSVHSNSFLALFELIQRSPKKVGKWFGNKKYLREAKQSAKSKSTKTQGLMIDKKVE